MDSIKNMPDKDLLGITFRGSNDKILNYPKRSTIKLDENGVLIYKIPYTNKFDYYPIFMHRRKKLIR